MSTDGEMSCISIKQDGAPLEQPEKVDILTGPKELPEQVIQKYAEATGVSVIRLRDLAKRGLFGELVRKLGAASQGSWMLMESEDMIKEGLKSIDSMLGDYAHDPKAVASLVKARLGYVDLWIKAAEAHISGSPGGPEGSDQRPQNVPPPPLVPIQINVSPNQVSITEQPK